MGTQDFYSGRPFKRDTVRDELKIKAHHSKYKNDVKTTSKKTVIDDVVIPWDFGDEENQEETEDKEK